MSIAWSIKFYNLDFFLVGTCDISSGIFTAISSFSGGGAGAIITGLITSIVAIGFVAAAFMDILMLSKVSRILNEMVEKTGISEEIAYTWLVFLLQVHRIYRSSGASMAKAQEEFTSGILKNEHVRGAAAGAATAAMQSQFQQGSRSPPSRY